MALPRSLRRQGFAAAWVLAALAFVGAACSGQDLAKAPESTITPPGQPRTPPESEIEVISRLPLATYFESARSIYTQTDALLREAIRSCMTDQGFDYLEPPIETIAAESFAGYGSRYGLVSLRQQSTGYSGRLDRSVSTSEPSDNDPIEADPPSPQYTIALYGADSSDSEPIIDASGVQVGTFALPSGCVGTATASVFGSVERYQADVAVLRTVDEIQAESLTRLSGQIDGTRELEAWSRCLNDATGLSWLAPSDGYEVDWSSTTPQFETQVATADVNCKWETGLASLMINIDTEWQQQRIEENPGLLSGLAELRQRLAELA